MMKPIKDDRYHDMNYTVTNLDLFKIFINTYFELNQECKEQALKHITSQLLLRNS